MVRFEWDPLRWLEEDEPIYGHPRNPYSRVDALRSHRHVRVQLDDVVLADTVAPVAAIRNRLADKVLHRVADVAFEHLEPSSTRTLCPYKGTTSGYWSVRLGDAVHPDLAWTYHYPLPPSPRSPAWWRSTTRSSTSSSTVSRCPVRRRSSAERYSTLRPRRRSALPLDDRDRVPPQVDHPCGVRGRISSDGLRAVTNIEGVGDGPFLGIDHRNGCRAGVGDEDGMGV